MLVGLVLLAAPLAGCMGGEDVSQTEDTGDLEEASLNDTEENLTEQPEEPELVVTKSWHNGTVEGGSFPAGGSYCMTCENTLEFPVPDGTEAIHVEAAWEENARATLNVSGPECESYPLFADVCRPGDSDNGGSPLTVVLEDERTNVTGTWRAMVWVDETTPSQIEVTIVATVVEQGQLPNGYSALDQS